MLFSSYPSVISTIARRPVADAISRVLSTRLSSNAVPPVALMAPIAWRKVELSFVGPVMLPMCALNGATMARSFGRRLEMDLLEPLARGMVVVLCIYGVLRVLILRRTGALAGLLDFGYESTMFLIEMGVGVVVPVFLLLFPRIRRNQTGMVASAFLVVIGFVMYRLNVSVTGMERAAGVRYLPSVMELMVSVSLVAIGFAVFAMAVRFLPIFPQHEE